MNEPKQIIPFELMPETGPARVGSLRLLRFANSEVRHDHEHS
jgi:hypothetical protein